MCGIVGHIVPRGGRLDVNAVTLAVEKLAHRGPNDSGIARFETACLGHRRLSIIDVAGSVQPWSSEDGRYTLIFNGEIYNYIELRDELKATGFRFRSDGDTEVLLAMYIRDRENCLNKLNGMFSFAVWDDVAKRLFVARDRMGKKPLFYAVVDRGVAFASEIEPLLAFTNIETSIDAAAVQDFFAYQYIPAPRTIYRRIRKLPAAHFMTYEEGRVDIQRYWTPPRPVTGTSPPLASLCDELRALFRDSVRLRLRSDVPLGAFLSGGLDSSIVVGVMINLGFNVDTFHVGFDESSYDESAYAKIASDHFGTRHHSVVLPLDYEAVLDTSLAHFGEPFADPSSIPTWHLCKYTRQTVTVALSGDGADELFAGYRRYYARQFISHYLSLPQFVRKRISKQLLRWIPETNEYYGTSLFKKLRLFIDLAERTAAVPGDLLAQTFSLGERRSLLHQDVPVAASDHVAQFDLMKIDDVTRMMLTDVLVYLPDDILVKVDRMSMAHALEVRNPFLDHRLVEFVSRLPLSMKLNGRMQKYILRAALGDTLPPSLRKRNKHGFAVPLGSWFRSRLANTFKETVLDATATEFVNRDAAIALWKEHVEGRVDHGFKLWSLFVFHRWYHRRRHA